MAQRTATPATSAHAVARNEPRDATMGVGRRLIDGIREHDVSGLAAEIAYRFLFAVFPFGLFVAALSGVAAGVLRIDNPSGKIIAGLGDNLPPSIAEALQPELERLFTSASNTVLWFGAIAALWQQPAEPTLSSRASTVRTASPSSDHSSFATRSPSASRSSPRWG